MRGEPTESRAQVTAPGRPPRTMGSAQPEATTPAHQSHTRARFPIRKFRKCMQNSHQLSSARIITNRSQTQQRVRGPPPAHVAALNPSRAQRSSARFRSCTFRAKNNVFALFGMKTAFSALMLHTSQHLTPPHFGFQGYSLETHRPPSPSSAS